jgi:uncharacterized damage-inducible protein DinB
MKNIPDPVRLQLARLLDWGEAHVTFEKAVDGIAPALRGTREPHMAHSIWQLLEHMRIAQKDLLDFCVNAKYVHALKWPDDYWPPRPAPPDPDAWKESLAAFKADREALEKLARNKKIDLLAPVPTGKKAHTYLRALLLVADHNAYHLGQLVAARRALGIWGD